MDVRLFVFKIALLVLVCDDAIAKVIVAALLGGEATLPCLVPSGNTDQVTWSSVGRILTIGRTTIYNKKRFSVQTPSPNELYLHINSVNLEDERTFTCNAGFTVIATVKVEVQVKPSWIENEVSHTRLAPNESTDVTLNCRADGRPEPVITWYKEENGQIVEPELPVTGYQLFISNITCKQTGDYGCTARNKHAEISRTISVDVMCLSTTLPTSTSHDQFQGDQTPSSIPETTQRGSSLLATEPLSRPSFVPYQVMIGILSTVIVLLLITNVLTAIKYKRNMKKNKGANDSIAPVNSHLTITELWPTTESSHDPVTPNIDDPEYINMTEGAQYEDLHTNKDVRDQTYTDLEK